MNDEDWMRRAVANAAVVRASTSPNPWVGAVVVTTDGHAFDGATEPPGGRHAEIVALDAAGDAAKGSTVYVTLEPCSHTGRTGPCADALIAAGVARVVVAVEDPDEKVSGEGIHRMRTAGIDVVIGAAAATVRAQLAPYLKHRSTGRPYVVLKLAASLDGRTAAPDGTSQWITGDAARTDAHRIRAESDAVIVGAGTVRTDDPSLTVRHVEGRDPLRVVLGTAPADAKVHPALELAGDLGAVLDELGRRDVVQAMIEGGAAVAHDFHAAGLVDRYVVYVAPALFGGDDARGLFAGPGAQTIADVWRGRITSVVQLGDDIRIEMEPGPSGRLSGKKVA
ncbi:MAG TPA: bifunctional diaminohydroxyphosphoribosylaminopyrimidine deaminase/5-amino-6-(5-phosphoribosylamino)uracil reductase RibD [Acidimicrobiales bacterium]|nr:bifunctional diaminohydroxyphosphoribosylaminopyrimidine deaminase/5-amino-6-(5-phosphoribosylamino)uracil reductase RibD [Acidimicrobiales bacterium]